MIAAVSTTFGEVRCTWRLSFLPGADYEFELMVVDAAGSQSYAVGSFPTAG